MIVLFEHVMLVVQIHHKLVKTTWHELEAVFELEMFDAIGHKLVNVILDYVYLADSNLVVDCVRMNNDQVTVVAP